MIQMVNLLFTTVLSDLMHSAFDLSLARDKTLSILILGYFVFSPIELHVALYKRVVFNMHIR